MTIEDFLSRFRDNDAGILCDTAEDRSQVLKWLLDNGFKTCSAGGFIEAAIEMRPYQEDALMAYPHVAISTYRNYNHEELTIYRWPWRKNVEIKAQEFFDLIEESNAPMKYRPISALFGQG